MNRIAVFGKPGSGKSALSQALASETNITLHHLDNLQYLPNGDPVDPEVFKEKHRAILDSATWIIDGFGPISSFYERLEKADTLIYIDLPYLSSYWFVTKRLLKGLIPGTAGKPLGWPEGSSLLKGTWQSYKVLRLCPKFWNEAFEQKLKDMEEGKKVFILRSAQELKRFAKSI